jgi:16S rRNA (guanine1516-N2)-methyltransferase
MRTTWRWRIMPNSQRLPEGLVVWADGPEDSECQKLARRLGVPYVESEDPPGAEEANWLFFREDDALYLHSTQHEYNPIVVDYLEGDFYKRWKQASRNDLLVKACGLKKGVRSICDATCGLGYDAFFLSTFKDLEVTACERNAVVAELTMDALVRVKDDGRFEDQPMFFHFGDGREFLETQGAASFDCVYLDPMYPREDEKSAKQKKEMLILREIVGKDQDAEALFAAAFQAARRRVVVKRPDDAPPLVADPKPSVAIEGKTVRYDIYLK